MQDTDEEVNMILLRAVSGFLKKKTYLQNAHIYVTHWFQQCVTEKINL